MGIDDEYAAHTIGSLEEVLAKRDASIETFRARLLEIHWLLRAPVPGQVDVDKARALAGKRSS